MRSLGLKTLVALVLLESSNMAVAMQENEYSFNQRPNDNKRDQPVKTSAPIINNGFTRKNYTRAQRRALKRGR